MENNNIDINTVKLVENADSNNQPKINTFILVLLGLVAIGIATILVYLFFNNDTNDQKNTIINNQATTSATQSSFSKLKTNPNYKEATDLYFSKNYEEAHKRLEIILESKVEKDSKIVQSMSLLSAAALVNHNLLDGVEYYQKISNDQTFSALNRGYAILMATQVALGQGNINVLKIFSNDPEKFVKKTIPEKTYEISKQNYLLYPFGLPLARATLYEVQNNKDIDFKKKLFEKVKPEIEKDILELQTNEGLSHLSSNTSLNYAQLSAYLQEFNITNYPENRLLFEQSYKLSKEFSPQGTQQFVLLYFAEFEAVNGNTEKILTLLTVLQIDKIQPNVKNNLVKSELFKQFYPNLYKLYSVNKIVKSKVDEITKVSNNNL